MGLPPGHFLDWENCSRTRAKEIDEPRRWPEALRAPLETLRPMPLAKAQLRLADAHPKAQTKGNPETRGLHLLRDPPVACQDHDMGMTIVEAAARELAQVPGSVQGARGKGRSADRMHANPRAATPESDSDARQRPPRRRLPSVLR